MKNEKTIVYKLASVISIVGNPLITLSLFILFITFQLYNSASAILISSLVIGGVAIPVTLNNYLKVKKGHITNFDMSDRTERHTFYPRLILLLAAVTIIFYVTGQPESFRRASLVFVLMIVTSYLINFKLKVSMHTSISVFLALTLFKLSLTGGVAMSVFALLISTSRLVLKRHTGIEVISGVLLGLVFGLINYYL